MVLEAELKRLEAEYNMFFAGRLPRLPWETRARVEALIKGYDRQPMTNTAQRFRFGTLQAKFQTFVDLWEKQLKAREEGRPLPGQARRRSSTAVVSAAPPPMVEGAFGVAAAAARAEAKAEKAEVKKDRDLLHEARIKDPLKEGDRLKELYQRLSEARAKTGEAQIPFDRFAQVVRAQVTKLGGGDQEVSFRVAMKKGKVTLVAKAKGEE
jgi:hypothetical protein